MREIAWIRLLSTSGERGLALLRAWRKAARTMVRVDVLSDFLRDLAICHLRCASGRDVDGERRTQILAAARGT